MKEPTPAEREAQAAAADLRELHRLQTIAKHARALVGDLDVALSHALAADTYYMARTYLMGSVATFARAVVRLIETI